MPNEDNKRTIIDAKADSDGNITHVKLEDNKTFTPYKKALEMARKGEIDVVYVKKNKNKKSSYSHQT